MADLHARCRSIPLIMFLYIGTALLQPTLTDKIRYSGGAGHVGWPPTLLATLSNTLAMTSLITIASGRLSNVLCSDRATLRRVLIATAFDFISGCSLTTGLLMVGGATFVVIYSSTTVWTALWARCWGEKLTSGRWTGVLLISGGMILSASGSLTDAVAAGDAAATTTIVLGCGALVVGTMLHAAMFVYSENAIKKAGIDLLLLCSSMGTLEASVLGAWNLSLLASQGPSLYQSTDVANSASLQQLLLHAWAFFNMLEKVGAVSSAVMKGLQLVLVFAFSVVYFCQFQSTQCFTVQKASGVAVVAAGLLVYAYSTVHAARRQREERVLA